MRHRRSNTWNRSAGANLHSREARGKHTHSRRYVSGDNWVECQRCGHDIYGSDAQEDGYTQGLIVCPKCYDAPHPQDYVRAYEDKISPSGPVTGSSGNNEAVGMAGSTSNPAQTSFTGDDFTGSVSTIPDQTDVAGDTISTLTLSTYFPTSLYDTLLGAEQTIATYSVTNLPASLVLDGSTGDITGTIDFDADTASPYSLVVTVTFTNGYQIANPFAWTVTAMWTPLNLGPGGWWDMSFAGVQGIVGGTFQDSAGTTPCTDNTQMSRVDDLSGNDFHATVVGDTVAHRWRSAGLSGNGIAEFHNSTTLKTTDFVADNEPEWTIAALVRIHNQFGGQPEARSWVGGGGTSHSQWVLNAGLTAGSKKYRVDWTSGEVLTDTYIWTSSGDLAWVLFIFDVNQTTSNSYVDGVFEAAGDAFPDAFGPGEITLGGHSTTGGVDADAVEYIIVPHVMTSAEHANLVTYYNARYGLSL